MKIIHRHHGTSNVSIMEKKKASPFLEKFIEQSRLRRIICVLMYS